MASWRDDKGRYAWGVYNNTADYEKIYVVGGPGGGDSDYFNIPSSEMQGLRDREYGTGIHFWWSGDSLNITINMIVLTSTTSWNIIRGEYYRGNPNYDKYEFYADIQYQKRNGQWVKIGDNLIKTVTAGSPLYDRYGWDTQETGFLWKTFSYTGLDFSTIQKFSIGIHGDNASVTKWVEFPIETIAPKPDPTRPWAIRKSGNWISFTQGSKEMKSRSGGNFSKRHDQKIRKNGSFVLQGKVGN